MTYILSHLYRVKGLAQVPISGSLAVLGIKRMTLRSEVQLRYRCPHWEQSLEAMVISTWSLETVPTSDCLLRPVVISGLLIIEKSGAH